MRLGIWWLPCSGGARVLQVLGDTPCPVVPAALDGVPVTEIGPYCFAARRMPLPEGARFWGAKHPHEIAGSFLEEVTLPDTVHTLHSAAFYDCRRLRRLSVGAELTALGSDLFTNCRALESVTVRAAADAATGLKRLVGAVSADLLVEFSGAQTARLFYPEYWEVLDENAPAHLFDRGVEGEGYRYRQCFTGAGAVDYPAYDAAFPRATVGESPAKLCRLALGRLLFPFALAAGARQRYEQYLRGQPDAALTLAVAGRDSAALQLLCGLGISPVDAAAACARAGWSAGAAAVFGAGTTQPKKQYDFDDL